MWFTVHAELILRCKLSSQVDTKLTLLVCIQKAGVEMSFLISHFRKEGMRKEELSVAEGRGKIRVFPDPRFRWMRKPRTVPNGQNFTRTWSAVIWYAAERARYIIGETGAS